MYDGKLEPHMHDVCVNASPNLELKHSKALE